ncbi:PREDICTED: uncharacterized protein LOC109229763 [Nicotiana attenuata]|uniref:uncharacterized protein LOC109229763 n=1 Tax=Nicotiana attenuata TaxID=49451 RepID=UPI00090523E1|nr:PREDICTED: uncharacterized protein LOC109229763 [Nicotiana attenuata]
MGDSSSSTGPYIPEPTSPLFLLPSDVRGVSLVSVPFSGTGFGGWKRNMIVSLSTKNKIGFIDGSCVKPAETSPQYRQRDRCNNMVISWLTNSLSLDIAESVQYSETAESIWKQLNNRYGIVSGTKVFEIKRELSSTYQGSLDVASYFNKLKKLWDELEIMRSSHANACNCAAKEGLQKEKEEDKVHQFLLGLNEVYVGVRSNILMMHPLPSLDSIYNILLQDEKQRQVLPSPQAYSESASFHANLNKFAPQFSPQQQHPQKLKSDQYNQRNFKFTRGKRFGSAAVVEGQHPGVSDHALTHGEDSLIPGLTKEQYNQLMSLLQQSGLNESSSQPVMMGFANFAGNSSSLPVCLNGTSSVRMLTNVAGRIWIVDSGATDHMTSNKNLLFIITPLPIPYLVSLPNGYKVKVTCTGSLTLLPYFTLHHAHSMKKLLELGRMDHGLYKFYYNQPTPHASVSQNLMDSIEQTISFPAVSDSFVSSPSTITEAHDSSLNAHVDVLNSLHDPVSLPNCNRNQHINKNDVLWHHRLGHIPFALMKNITSISSSLSGKHSFICPICPLARQPRMSFPNSSTHSTTPFQLIHVDTWGPYHTQTYSGAKYFLTIADDYSRAT